MSRGRPPYTDGSGVNSPCGWQVKRLWSEPPLNQYHVAETWQDEKPPKKNVKPLMAYQTIYLLNTSKEKRIPNFETHLMRWACGSVGSTLSQQVWNPLSISSVIDYPSTSEIVVSRSEVQGYLVLGYRVSLRQVHTCETLCERTSRGKRRGVGCGQGLITSIELPFVDVIWPEAKHDNLSFIPLY